MGGGTHGPTPSYNTRTPCTLLRHFQSVVHWERTDNLLLSECTKVYRLEGASALSRQCLNVSYHPMFLFLVPPHAPGLHGEISNLHADSEVHNNAAWLVHGFEIKTLVASPKQDCSAYDAHTGIIIPCGKSGDIVRGNFWFLTLLTRIKEVRGVILSKRSEDCVTFGL